MLSTKDGESVAANEEGYLVIQSRAGHVALIFSDPDRYVQQYWSRFEDQGWYLPDSAKKMRMATSWIISRIDDVIKVSATGSGTAEIEMPWLVTRPVAGGGIGVPISCAVT